MKRMYDNTRISSHKECNRKFYFRHVLDWTPEGSPPELVFGGAWHSAMDHLWTSLSTRPTSEEIPTIVSASYDAFTNRWQDDLPLPEEMDVAEYERLGIRVPATAVDMLVEYAVSRAKFIFSGKLLAVERPFVVPLDPGSDPDLFYCGRLDKVFETEEGILVIEHKTSSQYKKEGVFKAAFTESFSPNSQVDGYAYTGNLLYGKAFKRVMIDAALVHKTKHDGFSLIPVQRDEAQLDAWRWETLEEVRRIEESLDRLTDPECTTLPYLPAFPKNTGSCYLYNRPCPYMDLCKSWSNPHGRPLPQGYEKDHWSPFDHIDLEKLGFKREEMGE